ATTSDSKYSRPTDFFTSLSLSDLEHGEESLLRDLDAANALHALLAFLLLLEQLALSRDVAAVALGEHVLAQRANALARHHAAADRGLDGDLEHLARDELAHLRRERTAAGVGV